MPEERSVKEELLKNTESAGIDVHVETRPEGKVRLYGIVDTLSQKTAAEAIARRAPGVRGVENDLTVHLEKGRDGENLRQTLAGRFARNPRTEAVGAELSGGKVILLGGVATAEDEEEALTMARGVPGVSEVSSRLKVGVGRDDDDAVVSRQAKRLLEQMGLDPGQFTLWCDAGHLFVRGLVDNEEVAGSIRRLLGRLDGVAEVDALLPVDPDVGH